MSALRFTVLVTDWDLHQDATQEDLNKCADRITRLASKHQDFYLTRIGDVTVELDED